jgi:predicted alpha/beta hydrolase family esterase
VEWVETLDRAIGAAAGDVVLAAHSLGCATVAHWASTADASARGKVRGALLVAPSDVEAPHYPEGTVGFRPMPLERLTFPTIVVASRNDIWITFARAESFARAWGSRLVDVGDRGHINSDSNLGAWPEGQALLASF